MHQIRSPETRVERQCQPLQVEHRLDGEGFLDPVKPPRNMPAHGKVEGQFDGWIVGMPPPHEMPAFDALRLQARANR